MPLSWNEIKSRALKFSQEWSDESSEDAEAKSFWDAFFTVFGVPRRRFATFETHVKKIDGRSGYIDLLWKGILLIEHKSRGQDLTRAYAQAKDYFPGIKDRDLPRYVLVSDFEHFHLYDLETGEENRFRLKELHHNVKLFGFIAGYQSTSFKEQDPVNIKAAERMGRLHDKLKEIGYDGHALEVYLVRLLFCLFAEDAGVFERRQFQDFIEQRTAEDGSDLAARLAELFSVLNIDIPQRFKNLDEQLAAFRYVNGSLFAEHLPIASFDHEMRENLLECCALDWSRISPAIFGAMFQSIMDKKLRRNLGAHYTSEKNIMKVIGPLFLDDLREEFESIKTNARKLEEFHRKIAKFKFLDPACGCGNFLIIAYRELRLLELDILRVLLPKKYDRDRFLDISPEILCNVDQFYGIEIEEFPAQIAQTALWLIDHQMNMRIGEEFGMYFVRLPLKASATILNSNALQINWRDVVRPEALSFILGNPPFIGKHYQTKAQKEDVANSFANVKNVSDLDFVAGWYGKAVSFMAENKNIKAAFVSTSSITQGEQVGVLWPYLLKKGVKIIFAHRTFQWSNEASGLAAVHCVIIGFALHDVIVKRIFEYESIKSDPHEIRATNINPYLTDAPDIVIQKRSKPLSDVPPMRCGNKPSDGGFLILSDFDAKELLRTEPKAKKYIKPFIGAEEYLNKIPRWCLWLYDITPNDLKSMPQVLKRVEAVRAFRQKSTAEPTRKAANTPTHFFFTSQPQSDYILVPEVSSERRLFVPISLMPKEIISANTNYLIPSHSLYLYGVMQSSMHMAWMRSVSGRLESRYRYSGSIVYNTFPWPENCSQKQRHAIEIAAQEILDARASHADASLADLYDPNNMPPNLVKAHHNLDKAVDAAYSKKKFTGDADRVAFLFEMYQKLAAPLDLRLKKGAQRRSKKNVGR